MATIDPITGLPSSNTQADPVTSPISTSSLATATPINVPIAPPVDYSTYTTPISNTAQYVSDAAVAQKEYDDRLAEANSQVNEYSSLINTLGGKGADTANAYETGGVNKAASQINSLNAQITGLNNEAQAIPIQIQQAATGQGVTDRGVAPIQAARLRENALKALSIGQQAAVAKADYDTAKSLADQKIEIKYGAIEAKINAKKAQLDYLGTLVLTPAQEKARVAREKAVKAEEQDVAERKANEKTINDLILNANQQGAPKKIIDAANEAIKNGKKPMDIANILGVYAGDHRTALLLEQQLRTQKAQEAKAYADIENTKADTAKKRAETSAASTGAVYITNTKGQQVPVSAKGQQAAEAYALATSILNSKSLGKSVGASSLFNKVPGTKGRDFELKVDQLKNALAVPNLDKLKGAMSDKDIAFLKNIATSLDTSMTEQAFKSEALKVQNIMKQAAITGGYDSASLSQYASQDTPLAPVTNKFQTSLGVDSSMPFQGTAIINKSNGDGTFDFKIPTN
jgi:hypothetical protein